MKIQILKSAESHLDAIFTWYKDKGRDTAKKMCRKIKEELLPLADHPKMGKVDPLFPNDEDNIVLFLLQKVSLRRFIISMILPSTLLVL